MTKENKKIKIAVAISEKKEDFDSFCNEVLSSPKLKNKVEFIFSKDKEHLKTLIPQAEILVSFSINKETFLSAKNLKWIHLAVAGADKSLFPEVLNNNLILTTSRGIHKKTMAEHIFAMILIFAKGFDRAFRFQKEKEWKQKEVIEKRVVLEGKTLGIVGLGSIGQEVARLGKCFGMNVFATKNKIKSKKPKYVDKLFPKTKLSELLKSSDFVIILTPLTKETYHLIGEKELSQMKRTAYLINVARGKIVDEKALIQSLKDRKITGAGLDVFEEEPLKKESELYDLENVIITPHIAGSMPDYFKKVAQVFKINLERYLEKKKMLNLVDKKLGY